ncbi:MAG TPA: hypothetical protein VMU52_09220 [Steroidobacteraceae bacterium]|nr:hypothetical protein [Steroidobacteraceae bacterium]
MGLLVARSAQLTLTAAPADHALALQVTRVSDHRPIVGAGNVTVTLDGRSVPAAAQPNGTYLISTRDQSAGAHSLSVVVSHDGIRELLTATVSVPQQRNVLDMIQSHGMSAWWVLNIAVVLIAVLIISRRRG